MQQSFSYSPQCEAPARPVPPRSPEAWFDHLFDAKAARRGGIVRRRVKDMERCVGRARFAQELARRGYSAVENAGQVVVFCNSEPLRRFSAVPNSR